MQHPAVTAQSHHHIAGLESLRSQRVLVDTDFGGKTQGATGYWGSDGAVGTNGYWYYADPGANGNSPFLRRALLNSADMSTALAAPWVSLTNLSGSGAEMFVTNFAPLPSQRWYRVRSP